MHLALRRVSSDFHSVFFAIFTQFFFVHPINLKGHVVFLYFSKTNSYFQGWFYKIPGQKALCFKFQEFSRTKVNFFQVCANPVRACLILYATLTPKFNLWIYVVVMECLSLFLSTVTLISGVSSWKMHPQQIAYFIYGSIPYLVYRYLYILKPGESPAVSSRSLWPWPLVSVLARSSSEHFCI